MSDGPQYISEDEYQNSARVYRRLPMLFKKSKKTLLTYRKLKTFKEPALLLMRVGGNIEFYENATGDTFKFEHSNTKKCKINLTDAHLKNMDYGKNTFKTYICHEDSAYPIIDFSQTAAHMNSELVEMALQKYSIEREKLALENAKQEAKKWMNVFIGIALVIIAFAVYKMMTKPDGTTAQVIQQNITNITTAVKAASTSGIQVIP